MGLRRTQRDYEMRRRLALEAARICYEQGVRDFHLAKRKAADRLAAHDTRNMPSNMEIEQALLEHQRLFAHRDQGAQLRGLREQARAALQLLARFRPRLVGSVLSGAITPHSDINLHLFTDTTEEVAWFLLDRAIPFEQTARRLRYADEQVIPVPVFRFQGEVALIDAAVLSCDGERHAPLSPVDGKPMQRADLKGVEALLAPADEAVL